MIYRVAYVGESSQVTKHGQISRWQYELKIRGIELASIKPVYPLLLHSAVNKLRDMHSPEDSLGRGSKPEGTCYESYLIDGRLIEVLEKPDENAGQHPLIVVRSSEKLAGSNWMGKLERRLSLYHSRVQEEKLPEEVRKVLSLRD